MSRTDTSAPTFGDLLRQLRRRAGMTQGELAAQVGLSTAQISRLEQNERLPDLKQIAELFTPVLTLPEEAHLAQRLVELAALARGERPPIVKLVARSVQTTIQEQEVDDPGALPQPAAALIGRERELGVIARRLAEAPGRLLTLIGPPGVGKTRLGLEVAARLRSLYRDGAVFVALAAISDPEVVASTIAAALGLTEPSNKPALTRLIEHLRRKELLLVLDNFEQVAECAPLIATLLQECAGLRLLATSREPLRLRAEQRYKVQSLAPASAVELFLQRAQAVDPDFAPSADDASVVAEICLRLDCLPLAIELVAARVDLLSPQAMLARLQESALDLLDNGARDLPAHQRTLRAAIRRSYDLLSELEKRLFRNLGVFFGGCDLESVAVFGFGEQELRSLVAKSLVQRDVHGADSQRFTLLETLREFACEQLADLGEETAARRRHADYFLALAEAASRQRQGKDQHTWLERLEREHDNLRIAMRWLIDHDPEGSQQMGGALREFWYVRNHFVEGRQLLAEALAASSAPSVYRGHALLTAARFAHVQDKYEEGVRLIEESLTILRLCNDQEGCAEALRTGGWIAHSIGQSDRALAMFEEALELSRSLDNQPMIADLLISIAQLYALEGAENHFEMARRYFDEAMVISAQLERIESAAYALLGHSSLHFMSGDYTQSVTSATIALKIFQELDFRRNIALTQLVLAEANYLNGDLAAAREAIQTSHALYQQMGIPWGVSATLQMLGQIERRAGDPMSANRFLKESLSMSWDLRDSKLIAVNLMNLGGAALLRQRFAQAVLLLATGQQLLHKLPRFLAPGYRAEFDALTAAAQAALDDEEFANAWRKGEALSLEQAVAAGLAEATSGETSPDG